MERKNPFGGSPKRLRGKPRYGQSRGFGETSNVTPRSDIPCVGRHTLSERR